MEQNSKSDKKAADRLDARKDGAHALRDNAPNQMVRTGSAVCRVQVLRKTPLHPHSIPVPWGIAGKDGIYRLFVPYILTYDDARDHPCFS